MDFQHGFIVYRDTYIGFLLDISNEYTYTDTHKIPKNKSYSSIKGFGQFIPLYFNA